MVGIGIPRGAAIAINDLLDNCLEIKPHDEVALLAHIDGLSGGICRITHRFWRPS